ncbi:hypothetical protein K2Z84_28785 [Candidatus Binatia bacterium]|jgi:hypothetical protein|nr:hypothetical protein [Candidatus Binatia bacterium]
MKKRTTRAAAVAAVAGILGTVLAVEVTHAASVTLTEATRCRKAITTQGRVYAKKRLGLLLGCVDKLLKCEILSEVDGGNQNACRTLAEDSCNDRLGSGSTTTLGKAQASFDEKAGASCVVFDLPGMLSTAAGGLWYANDATCAASPDVPTLIDCIRGQIEQEVDAAVGNTKPRAGILLANMGLGDEFPNLPLPPVQTLVVGAASPGTIQPPGAINLPAGTALRVEGDPGLACTGGSSNNGNLTITVGTQSATIKEPWGPTRFALFGPYTTSGSVAYTIDLKDQSCNDSASGNVVIP